MSRSGQPPDLKKYMDKKLQIKLNVNRVVIGTLQGFDQFMNLVVDNTVEVNGNEKTDSLRDVRKRHDNNRESTSQQGSNDIRAPQERQTEWARHGRVLNRNINRGGYSRNSLPGVTREFRIVKDNRTKQKADGETVSESLHNGDSSNGQALSNFGDKSSTEKLAAQRYLVTRNSNGHGTIQADNGCKIAAQAHDKEVKPSSDQGLEQSEGTRTKLVSPHAVLVKGNQNKLLTVPSGTKNFTGELCCSSSDPIHVPFPGSKSAGTFGAIKREVGVVGARQRPSDSAATNTSTSNSLVTAILATKDNASNEQQSRLPGASSKNSYASSSVSLSSRPVPSSQYHSKPSINVGHSKVNSHLEWKPKSVNPRSVNHAVTMAPSSATSSVDGNQVGLVDLSKKLSRANVFEDEHVIIPEHLRVPDSERTHLIFGSFEPEVESKALTSVSDTATKEGLNGHSATSLTALNSVRSTDNVPPSDQTDLDGFCAAVSQSDSVVSVSEHQQLMTEDMEVPNPGAIGECRSNEMISKVTHSFPQSQHQGNSAVQNFKAYEPDSRYEMPFITKAADGETAQTIAYSSEIMGLHPGNVNQLSVSATQQPVPQMYQQVQVPQYPNFLSYRHVFSPYYVPPVAVPNYSSNPAFPQLPHASSYLVMPNGTSQLAANGVKYGPPHQYKQVFPGAGSPAGYGGYANHVSTGVIGSTGTVEDASMSKYKDNNLYTPNPQVETTDVWIQAHRDIPNMPSAPFYNLMGQPVSPHTAYLPEHNAHAPFSPAPHAAHLQYPGMPHTLQPTSMTMVQNPQSMLHQPAAPPLAGNGGIDMTAMAPGAQVGAIQQNQLGHLGWAPNF